MAGSATMAERGSGEQHPGVDSSATVGPDHRPAPPVAFDADGPGLEGRLFGLPHSLQEALVRVLPVPFEATTSYRRGTASAPALILEASSQVDLFDLESGTAWRRGIALAPPIEELDALNLAAVDAADRARGGSIEALHAVERAGRRVNEVVADFVGRQLDAGAVPGLLGGDHSVAFGGIVAAAERLGPLGVLQVDAHADLRPAYEGFRWSHASVMHNVLAAAPGVVLSSVGVRDLAHQEHARIASDDRIHAAFDPDLAAALDAGTPWTELVERMLRPLPEDVWVSLDVDGLDPSLCPATGTPVPGGLSWWQVSALGAGLLRSGRRIVGFDLCEVGAAPWDAIVGARLLYKLACWSILSHRRPGDAHVRS